MDAFLRHLRNQRMGSFLGSSLTFFQPTPAFYEALEPFKEKSIVDAGAGMGHVSKEGCKRGFRMLPIDIMPREGQWDAVMPVDAESMHYSEGQWLLVCRPDHSGWAYDTMEQALRAGAGVFYAGLERNFDCDLGDYLGRETKRWDNVGEDGETLFLFMPEALLPAEYD
jgi:hypothetical protein